MTPDRGLDVYFAGYRRGEDLFRQADIEVSTDQVIWCTDSGAEIVPRCGQDRYFRGSVVQAMIAFAKGELGEQMASLKGVKRVIAIGSDRMMQAVQMARHGVLAPYLDPKHVDIGSMILRRLASRRYPAGCASGMNEA
jgi:arginase family enzyme